MDRIAAASGALVCFRFDLVWAASLLYFATAISSDSYYYCYYYVRLFSIKPCLHTQLSEHNRSHWNVSWGWGHLITWNGPMMGHLNSFSASGGANLNKIFQNFKCLWNPYNHFYTVARAFSVSFSAKIATFCDGQFFHCLLVDTGRMQVILLRMLYNGWRQMKFLLYKS